MAASDCIYDRIIITFSLDEGYASSQDIYRFDEIHSLSNDEANKVSDHYPVWAEFYIDRDND